MKLLVLSAAFGTGHHQVATALAEAATAAGHSAEVVDGLAVGVPTLSKLLTQGFIRLLTVAPGLYRLAYARSEAPGRLDWLKERGIGTLRQLMWPRLAALLDRQQPDVVVCTHPFVLGVLANLRRRGRLQVPVAGVLTDFAPHAMWLHPGVDAYYTAFPDMALTMIGQGVAAERVQVTGIPVRQFFARTPQRHAVAAELGLDPDRPTVLIMGGGLGLGPMREMVTAACRSPLPLQVLVVAGHNARLYAELQPLCGSAHAHGATLRAYGYVSDVHRLMAVSDLLVSKPGAVTASEALAVGLPMLLVEPIPGHEERNQALLVATGAARAVQTTAEIPAALARLFASPEDLASMRQAARRVGQPGAAGQVVHHLTSLIRAREVRSA